MEWLRLNLGTLLSLSALVGAASILTYKVQRLIDFEKETKESFKQFLATQIEQGKTLARIEVKVDSPSQPQKPARRRKQP
jgi:hypothetical protein